MVEPPGVPTSIRERLGDEAAFDLAAMIHAFGRVWSDEVLTVASERFERRLAEELGRFRVEMTREMAALRVELLKWSFLFWIGQVAAMAGLLAFMLGDSAPR